MLKEKKCNEGNDPELFLPKYAAFTARLRYGSDGHLQIFAVKTKKAPIFNWGFSGGKEESVDGGNVKKTAQREYCEETTMDDYANKIEKYFKIIRRNNLNNSDFNLNQNSFANYFMVSFLIIEPIMRPKLSPKESVEALGWFSLSEFENLTLKQNHRIAFIELCYWLEEKFHDNETIMEDLKRCSYCIFERPTTVNGSLMFKFENGTSKYNEQLLRYLLPKNLTEGLRIEANPKG